MTMIARGERTSHPTNFYEQHKDRLDTLIADLTGQRPKTLDEAVRLTQPWAKGDHHRPEQTLVISDEQAEQLMGEFESMGLTQAILPPPGEYDQIIVLGGTHRANVARMSFLYDHLDEDIILADGGKISFWGGERDLMPEEYQDLVAASDSLPLKPELTETDSITVALGRLVARTALQRVHLRLQSPYLVSRRVLKSDNHQLEILNAAPTQRPLGEPRHTTESCAREWLEVTNLKDTDRVLFITGQPYARRTSHNVTEVFEEAGNHPQFELAACAASPRLGVRLFLGELARLLYAEQQLR